MDLLFASHGGKVLRDRFSVTVQVWERYQVLLSYWYVKVAASVRVQR